MKKKVLVLIAALGLAAAVFAQNIVTQSGYSVLYDGNGRAMLVVASSAPSLPVPPNENALLYRTDEQKFYQWAAGAWSSALSIATVTGDVTGDLTGDVTGDVTGNLTGDVTGSIAGGTIGGTSTAFYRTVTDNTGARTATAADCGTIITNVGDTDGSSVTLPDNPTAGCIITVAVIASQTMTITPASGESLNEDADNCAVSMSSATGGHIATISAVTGGSGAVWISDNGSFTCND
jgi:hypothetical protein